MWRAGLRGRIVAWFVIAALVGGSIFVRSQRESPVTGVELTSPRPSFDSFPPPHRRAVPAAARPMSRQDLVALGQRVPVQGPRQRLAGARNLYHLAFEELDAAVAGNGEAQYLIYLALDECRPFLRLDPDAALAMNERMLGTLSDLSDAERGQWSRDYGRCVDFAINDWRFVARALGDDEPGSESEVASAWFQRAVSSGYPPALAERALRRGTLPAEARQLSLERALQSGHPEVYAQCFFAQLGEHGALLDERVLAWLVLACRAGFDCREGVAWQRQLRCADHNCLIDAAPLLEYWDTLDAEGHARVDEWVRDIPGRIRGGDWSRLPLPEWE